MSSLGVVLGKEQEPSVCIYYHHHFILYIKNGNEEFLKLLEVQIFLRSCLKHSLLIKDGLWLRVDKENPDISATELTL